MSDEQIIERMITFVEEKEREIQKNRLISDSQVKNTAIKSIIDKLEEYTKNED